MLARDGVQEARCRCALVAGADCAQIRLDGSAARSTWRPTTRRRGTLLEQSTCPRWPRRCATTASRSPVAACSSSRRNRATDGFADDAAGHRRALRTRRAGAPDGADGTALRHRCRRAAPACRARSTSTPRPTRKPSFCAPLSRFGATPAVRTMVLVAAGPGVPPGRFEDPRCRTPAAAPAAEAPHPPPRARRSSSSSSRPPSWVGLPRHGAAFVLLKKKPVEEDGGEDTAHRSRRRPRGHKAPRPLTTRSTRRPSRQCRPVHGEPGRQGDRALRAGGAGTGTMTPRPPTSSRTSCPPSATTS